MTSPGPYLVYLPVLPIWVVWELHVVCFENSYEWQVNISASSKQFCLLKFVIMKNCRGEQAVLHEHRRNFHIRLQAELLVVLTIEHMLFSGKIWVKLLLLLWLTGKLHAAHMVSYMLNYR